jgi:formate C-acetyltransferase
VELAKSSLRTRTSPTERIRRLREEALEPCSHPNFEVTLYGGESWMQTAGELWWIVRRGMRTAHILRNMEVVIHPDDLIVGRPTTRTPSEEELQRLEQARQFLSAQPPAWGQSGHMAPDIETLLTIGCRGLQARIEQLEARLDPADPDAAPKLAFYRAAREALDGLCDFAERYAEEAERLSDEADTPQRARELREIAAVCRRVPAQPARTFHEALQAAHFLLFALNYVEGCVLASPGSIDRWLLPYLRTDLESGTLTWAQAQELLDNFFITSNFYVNRGAAIGMLLGGRYAGGEDAANELTWMALHALDHVRLAYPTTGLRVHQATDPELLDYALELLADGLSHPALFNDEAITAGLRAAGLPAEDACDYMNSTCVEITPCGKSNVWVASPYFNLPQFLLNIIHDIAAGRLSAPANFDELMDEYKKRLAAAISAGVAQQNAFRYSCLFHRNFPLASCFVADCIERGLDMEWGGARYNWIECSFVGLATVCDSLEAIRHFIFERRELDWQRLYHILQHNFDGEEQWRQRLAHQPAKYGNGIQRVDAIAREILDFAVAQTKEKRTVFGAGFHPGLFAWVMHGRLGEETGATPDGRRAGTAISPGPDPVAGQAMSGPTACVLSATSFDHTPLLGGVAFNLKFSPSTLSTRERRNKLAALVRTYFRRGGFQVQINVVGPDTLRDAQQHPEEYADLLVRVAGYSDYFVNLGKTLQDELIARSAEEL